MGEEGTRAGVGGRAAGCTYVLTAGQTGQQERRVPAAGRVSEWVCAQHTCAHYPAAAAGGAGPRLPVGDGHPGFPALSLLGLWAEQEQVAVSSFVFKLL